MFSLPVNFILFPHWASWAPSYCWTQRLLCLLCIKIQVKYHENSRMSTVPPEGDMCTPNSYGNLYNSCSDFSLELTNVNLMVASEERSRHHKHHQDASWTMDVTLWIGYFGYINDEFLLQVVVEETGISNGQWDSSSGHCHQWPDLDQSSEAMLPTSQGSKHNWGDLLRAMPCGFLLWHNCDVNGCLWLSYAW